MTGGGRAWAWAGAGAALLVLVLGFTEETRSAVTTWNASTAYGHCWLVLPIAAWLLWERRAVVLSGQPRPARWPALVAIPLALAWFAADWLGIMEGRQLALIGFAECVLLAALGWPLWWALSPAFLYLVFLVPFGAFLTPALQKFTTGFILGGLGLLDIPFDADSFQITIPEGVFYVAEACAGLRFLIASVAFGVLYAVTIFRSPWRRVAFVAVSCVVPVVANGVRGLGIVLLGHVLGSAEAGAADHLIYGWVFFSFVIVLLAASGLPFRQDMGAAARPVTDRAAPARGRLVLACVLPVLVLAYAGPVGLRVAEARPDGKMAALVPRLVLPAPCRAKAEGAAGPVSTQVVNCGATTLRVVATALPPGSHPARILDAGRDVALAGLGADIDSEAWHTPSGAPWMMLSARDTGHLAAYAVWIDGRQALGGLHDRVEMALDRLAGRGRGPVAIAVSLSTTDPDGLVQMRAFLSAQTDWMPLGRP